MLSQSESNFRVSICGAGIAGLVLAITIGKYDPSIPIDLYEAHDSIDTDGVGIAVWRRTHEIMIELELFDEFKQIFTHDPDVRRGPIVRRSDMREGGYVWFQRVDRDGPSAMHRQQMVTILEKNLPPSCTVHLRKRLVGYAESGQQNADMVSSVVLHFADGTTATTDVLVGADGVRSVVRKVMFETAAEDKTDGDKTDLGQYGEASFTGTRVYRCLFPTETLKREDPENISLKEIIAYHGKGKFCLTYPIAKGTMMNFVGMVSDPSLFGTHFEGRWVSNASHDELVKSFDDFEPDARSVIKLCKKPSKWALHVVKPLPFCVRKRVALIGDACHAMTPHMGAGAGQAIEDAFVLGRLLAHPLTTPHLIPDALRIYEEVRLAFAQSVASLSLSTGWMYQFMAPEYYDGTRRAHDLDDDGIDPYEREGMETMKQELFRRRDLLDGMSGALQQWRDAETKLGALTRQLAN